MELDDYKTGSKQVCVSMSVSDYIWIKKAGYSPSRLLRKAVNDLMNSKSQDDLQEMYLKTEKQAKIIQQAMEFLEKSKKSEEFFKFQDEQEQENLKIKKRVAENKEKVEEEIKEVLGEKDGS